MRKPSKASGRNNDFENLFSPGKSQNEIKRNFLDIFYSIERQPDSGSAILGYKQLLKLPVRVDQKYYEEIFINLCRLLEKNQFYGEELFYRLSCCYYFKSVLSVNQSITSEDKIKQAYTNIIIDLYKNPNKLKILIIDTELEIYQSIVEIIKITGNQQPYIFPGMESLIDDNCNSFNDFDLFISFNQNPVKALKTINLYREKHNTSKLFALYCSSCENARRIFIERNEEIDYILYTESMVYALLHITLKIKETTARNQGKNGDYQ